MEQKIQQLQMQITAMQQELNLIKASGTIPYEVEEAFKTRLNLPEIRQISARTAASEAQAVNEGGSASYDVASLMTGFITINLNGTTYDIPYYA